MEEPAPGALGDWPAFGLDSDMRPRLAEAMAAGEPSALVTLYAAEGPAPHGLGAQMLVRSRAASGFLSGGCIEGDVALHGRAVIEQGAARRLIYGRGGPPDIRLLCGARIELMVEPVGASNPAAARLLDLAAARTPALWLSDGQARACLSPADDGAGLAPQLRAALDRARSQALVAGPDADAAAIYRRFDPQPRVVVVGADPTALAIATLALSMGWAAAVVRPKGPLEGPPIPGVSYWRASPADAFAALRLDPWTAVAATSHDIEADGEALAAALPSAAGYVGVLGSRRRIPERLSGLREAGLDEAAIGRLRAPIGLPIAAQTPWEIAVAVLGEVVAQFKSQQAERLWPSARETA